MINLLGISYQNIGPFKDEPLSIFFQKGKFLVKAPIGAGKSFLFFDGPIYGLYKYSSRMMLNSTSKEGFIKLLFEVDGQHYLIIRNLKKGKVKESCNTTLYTVHKVEGPKSQKSSDLIDLTGIKTLQTNVDIQSELKKNSDIGMEEVSFKNETDLQQTLNTILPPREVFINTVFLMQDSDNIFELAPIDRLTVLKNVFNLIGIDEAKDKIADRKKEIWYKLKATADTSKYDDKLKSLLTEYIGIYKKLGDEQLQGFDISHFKAFFDELENLHEKVNITDFSVTDFPIEMHDLINEVVEKYKSDYQKLEHQIQTLQQDIKNELGKIKEETSQKEQLISNSEELKMKIDKMDPNKVVKLKEEKKSLQDQQTQVVATIKDDDIKDFHSSHKELFEDFKYNDDIVSNAYLFVQFLKNKGKLLNEELKNIELQIKHHIATLKEHKEQLSKVTDKIKILDKDVDQQATFDCSKIDTNCPFIKVINKKTFDQLDKQKNLLQEEKSGWEMKIKGLSEVQDFTSQQKDLLSSIDAIKSILETIGRKKIEDIHESYQKFVKQEKSIDQEIQTLEGDVKKLEEYKLQLEKNKVQIENIDKQIHDADHRLQVAEKAKTEIEKQTKNSDYSQILEIEKMNTKMKESYRDIKSLVNEFKDVQVQVKQLQEEEKIMGNLYTIFSKELLLLVLQDHLPVLSDIINSYLSQVVDYQISFSLHKSSTDKLELLAEIFDHQGERDVKSLSGGQRVILKIVWMLAISTYINSPVLFLDETINNLDTDTVGKVADMLEDFVKHRDMKLYTVTHSQQIQEMKFWDKIIELKME